MASADGESLQLDNLRYEQPSPARNLQVQDIQVCVFLDVRLFLRGDRVFGVQHQPDDQIALILRTISWLRRLRTLPLSARTRISRLLHESLARELQLRQKCASFDSMLRSS
jgi:hypothetical protein